MQVDGACHCGNITYRAEVDPEGAFLCHCTDCQTLSGCAFRTVVFTDEANFDLLSGEVTIYVKIADSGKPREQSFCGTCGTPIYSTDVGEGPRKLGLRVGAIKQRDQFKPKSQYWSRSAQDWVGGIDALPKVETQASGTVR